MAEPRIRIAAWRRDYNEYRPHSALNYQQRATLCDPFEQLLLQVGQLFNFPIDHCREAEGLIDVRNAQLYSLPQNPPPVIGACLTPDTAASMGTWVDGIITITQDSKRMQEIVAAFRENGGDGKPVYLQVVLSFAATLEEALSAAHAQWRQAALGQSMLADLDFPVAFDHATRNLGLEDVAKSVRVSADLKEHRDWLLQDAELGFDRLYLHNVHRDQRRFISGVAETILPAFKD